jgi:hypothetical protein
MLRRIPDLRRGYVYKFWSENLKGHDHLGNPYIMGLWAEMEGYLKESVLV